MPELVEAMDSGKSSVFAASGTSPRPSPEQQRAFLERRPNEERWTGCGVKRHFGGLILRSGGKRTPSRQSACPWPAMPSASTIAHSNNWNNWLGFGRQRQSWSAPNMPYGQEFLPEIEELAALAQTVLRTRWSVRKLPGAVSA